MIPRLSFKRSYSYFPKIVENGPRHFPCAVILPEVDPNPRIEQAVAPSKTGLPKFDLWNPYYAFMGVGKMSLDLHVKMSDMELTLQESTTEFDSLIKNVEACEGPLNFAWNTTRLLNFCKNNIYTDDIFQRIHKHATRSLTPQLLSKMVHENFQNVADTNCLDAWQTQLLQKINLEARLGGLALSSSYKKLVFEQLQQQIDQDTKAYVVNVENAKRPFYQGMPDRDSMEEFPMDLKQQMAQNAGSKDVNVGPWAACLHGHTFPMVLEYCPDKLLRFNIWKANMVLCSHYTHRELSNSFQVEKIRSDRNSMAKLLGFKDYANLSMQTKMAGSVDKAMSMITDIASRARQAQANEVESLRELSAANGQNSPLEPCDMPFWNRQHKKILYSIDEAHLQEYFAFNHVWDELVGLASRLYGLKITEYPQGEVATYHPDVRTFKVTETDGTYVATFYLDPYRRPGEKQEDVLGGGSIVTLVHKTTGATPLAALVYNFMQPSEQQPESLLSLRDVHTLFTKFGELMQPLLSKSPYAHVSGQTNMQWDVVAMPSKFMANWLRDPAVLKNLSKHYESGEQLATAQINDIISSYSHGSGFKLCNELYFAHFDMKLHTEQRPWQTLMTELWPQYSPFAMDSNAAIGSWFTDVFGGPWAAGYYSHLWSDMLAADVFKTFQDAKPEDVPLLGHKFREAFLSTGGGRSGQESFQELMGREPNLEAMFEKYGLLE